MLRWSAQPFLRYVLALMAGIVCYAVFPGAKAIGGAYPVGGVLLLALLYLFLLFKKKFGARRTGLAGLLLLSSLGFLVSMAHDERQADDHLVHLPGRVLAYEARVQTQPEQRQKSFRFVLRVERVRTAGGWQNASGQILSYLSRTAATPPRYGERWLIAGSPERVEGPRNPGQFDYRAFLETQQIYHRHFLKPSQRRLLGLQPPSRSVQFAYRINGWADSLFTHHLKGNQEFAIVKAMILGVRDAIDPDLQQAYSAAGAVHVLSVSGLHVGVLFWVLSAAFGWMRKQPRGKALFFILVTGTLWFYALMTGFSAPVLRSVGMFSLFLLAQLLNRQHNLLNTLAASAFLILLFDPNALFSAGFQLSYLAVGGLAICQKPLYQSLVFKNRVANWLWEMTSVALVAQLFTFPLAVYYFHQFPTYFWLANPLVIPLSSLVLILAMALLGTGWITGLSDVIGFLLSKSMWLLNQVVLLTERLPYSVLGPFRLTGFELILLAGLLVCLLLIVMERRAGLIWWAIGISVVLSFLNLSLQWQREKQRILVIHAGGKQPMINLIQGNTAEFFHIIPFSDSDPAFTFNVQGTFDSLGVPGSGITFSQLDLHHQSIQIIARRGKTIGVIGRAYARSNVRLAIPLDYLVVTQNAVRDWKQLSGRLGARTIILDESNGRRTAESLMIQARTAGFKSIFWTRETGAFVTRFE